jgi:hypothetical protein
MKIGCLVLSVQNRMRHSTVAIVIAAASLLLAPQAAHADPVAWAGGLFGLTVPNADGTTARPIFGITAGAKLGSEYGLGVYYMSSTKKENAGKFDFDLYGVEFGYHFEGDAKGVYFGGRLGTSKVNVQSASTSPFHWGVMAGYNYMLGEHFSVGGEAGFMSVASSTDSSAVGGRIDGFNLLNFVATGKFWF